MSDNSRSALLAAVERIVRCPTCDGSKRDFWSDDARSAYEQIAALLDATLAEHLDAQLGHIVNRFRARIREVETERDSLLRLLRSMQEA